MNTNNKNLNLFDYLEFPDRIKRDKALNVCDVNKLCLLPINDLHILFCNPYFEQYNTWSIHINNFKSQLWTHFLLLYHQYSQNPFDTLSMGAFLSPAAAHKILFDTFAEDVSLYLISYFDKHLEMFNALYQLKERSPRLKNKRNPSRRDFINEMKNVEELKELALAYDEIEKSKDFKEIILSIRNNFVHNKSSSYYGMETIESKDGVFVSRIKDGISTESTYGAICNLLNEYIQLCEQVNAFMKTKVS